MKKADSLEVMYQKRIQMTVSIVVITVGGIGLFAGIGYLLDSYLDTKPILLFVFIVLSFPLTQLLLYKRAQQLMKDVEKSN